MRSENSTTRQAFAQPPHAKPNAACLRPAGVSTKPLLAYRLEGSGPPLLLIHGFGISFNIWRNLLPLLRPHFLCVMIELPGIGQSPPPASGRPYYDQCAEEIERLRQHLRIDRWAIFAYSSGSRAAERYIQAYAARVAAVVLLCPLYLIGWRWTLTRALLGVDNCWPALGNWALSGHCLQFLVRVLGFSGQAHPSVHAWSAEIAQQDVNTLKRTLRDLPNAGYTLLELPTPVLYLWGVHDWVPHRPRRRLRRNVIIHRRIVASHSAPQQQAVPVARESLPFLQGAYRDHFMRQPWRNSGATSAQ
jgi:pimeloyl-ACP methyl ester carboxylesterase